MKIHITTDDGELLETAVIRNDQINDRGEIAPGVLVLINDAFIGSAARIIAARRAKAQEKPGLGDKREEDEGLAAPRRLRDQGEMTGADEEGAWNPADEPMMRTLSCGCCTNGCTCRNHMDIPRGLPPRTCGYHRVYGHPRVTSPIPPSDTSSTASSSTWGRDA